MPLSIRIKISVHKNGAIFLKYMEIFSFIVTILFTVSSKKEKFASAMSFIMR